MTLTLQSPAFENGKNIPPEYTCDGADRSPELRWGDPPAGTETFVLICDDPDAPGGTFDHWVLYDIPSEARKIPAGVGPDEQPPVGGFHGVNSFGHRGYGGPCPPSGAHRYNFRLYALDTKLSLPPSETKKTVESAMKSHILDQGELTGIYRR